jgi:hypothetical protein
MTTNLINISSIIQFVQNKPFTQIQEDAKSLGFDVRHKDELYLLTTGGHRRLDGDGEECDNELHAQCNGMILEKNTNKIVCASQNVFSEADDLSQLMANLSESGVQYRIEYCEDGTLIRLYHYNGSWHTSTNRCIDGKDSFWTSQKTFDALFWELFNRASLDSLDQNYTYLFILLHSENRIVIRHYHNKLVYVSRIFNRPQITSDPINSSESRFVLSEDYRHIFLQNTEHILRPKTIGNIDIQHLSNEMMFHPRKRGFIIKIANGTDSWESYRYDFPKYTKQKLIRGNVPDIKHRYLELLNDTEMLEQLFRLYPEHKSDFIRLRNQLHLLSKKIHQLYINSHIKHNIRVEETNPFFGFLKALHAQYKNTKTPIVLNDIKEKLKLSNRWLLVNYLNTIELQ